MERDETTMNEAVIRKSEPNALCQSGLPLFFELANAEKTPFTAPANRLGQALRTYARSLSVMQKEAVVMSSLTGRAWRLASDEGPYLNGHDVAPCPLSFLSTGMVCSYMNEFLALARQREFAIHRARFIQDNYYTMEGSALDGTMVGGALPVDLEIQVDSNADKTDLRSLALDAVAASPLNGFLRRRLESLFTLTKNGKQIAVGRVKPLDAPTLPATFDNFDKLSVKEGASPASEFIVKLREAETAHNAPGGAASSLQAKQSRKLHLRVTCTLRPDGLKEIEQVLFSPIGSTFKFLSDEPEGFGGQGRAPDAATYASAGIGFCFMTQLGRYAKIMKKDLRAYNIAQDTHFSLGGASGGTRAAGTADPVETHLYLTTTEDDDFARRLLDMGEQTCFLHALCRSELKTRVRVTTL
jgi:hypothetical protein